jgi:hypothetical protein
MPDQNASSQNMAPEPATQQPAQKVVPPDIPTLSEEFDRAKWTLPPPSILVIGIGAFAVVVAVVFWLARYKPTSNGMIDNVASVELADHASVLAAINVTVHNGGEKPFYVHFAKAQLTTDKGVFNDDAASAVDFERYFQAYPALREHAIAPLQPETKIPVGGELKGTVIVSFPVNEDSFEHRKSLSVIVGPYDQRPVVISK